MNEMSVGLDYVIKHAASLMPYVSLYLFLFMPNMHPLLWVCRAAGWGEGACGHGSVEEAGC